MPTVQKPRKNDSKSDDELHDKLMESFLKPHSQNGTKLRVLNNITSFFTRGAQVRKVVNVDCFDPQTSVKIRVVCFDDKTTFKQAQAMIVNKTYTVADFYRAAEGKIIVQDQTTIVSSCETVEAEVRIPYDQIVQPNKLSFLKLFVDRLQHKGPESLIPGCQICTLPSGCSCNSKRTLHLKNVHVILTDQKSLQVRASINFGHLVALMDISRTRLIEILSRNRNLDDLDFSMRKSQGFEVLIWNEEFKGKSFTVVSSIKAVQHEPPHKQQKI